MAKAQNKASDIKTAELLYKDISEFIQQKQEAGCANSQPANHIIVLENWQNH